MFIYFSHFCEEVKYTEHVTAPLGKHTLLTSMELIDKLIPCQKKNFFICSSIKNLDENAVKKQIPYPIDFSPKANNNNNKKTKKRQINSMMWNTRKGDKV